MNLVEAAKISNFVRRDHHVGLAGRIEWLDLNNPRKDDDTLSLEDVLADDWEAKSAEEKEEDQIRTIHMNSIVRCPCGGLIEIGLIHKERVRPGIRSPIQARWQNLERCKRCLITYEIIQSIRAL